MPIFGFNKKYNTPGAGVSKDEPKKPALVRFFEILTRKLTKLMQVNLLFLVPTILVLLLIFLLAQNQVVIEFSTSFGFHTIDIWRRYIAPMPVIFLYPFISGLTYITRNFVREEHAFIWHDFKETIKSNWKAFLLNGIISYIVYVVISFSVLYYYIMLEKSAIFYIFLALCIVVGVLFVFSQYYIPIMLVTFDLKLRYVYKNAFIFAIIGFFRNIGITILLLVILVLYVFLVPLFGITILIGVLSIALLLFSFVSYLINFAAYPLIEKHMIKPQKESIISAEETQQNRNTSNRKEEEESRKSVSKDKNKVYHNGRMVDKDKIS